MPTRHSRLANFLPYLLAITAESVSDVCAEVYRERFDLRLPEWRVLAVLGDAGALTQRDLARSTGMDKVAVNRACKALEDRGLVRRSPNDRDGRSHHLELSEQGLAIHREMMPTAFAIERRVFADLSETERLQLRHLLARVRTTVEWMDSPQAA
ncbi:MarR family winged helix-turn-helix transcriptional regulator [Novosphingobium aerophilum]|uniref:MarR family transcriptional regulator n=1 Tax=Novosphingobium aerophilum TaxID=2839843 RepID=A0A7X1F8A3_9SPHN|nr:MarR family transcriptional regulator [Novosphingobium aerophilum]MBC2652217.1 MarR family transcriptional regulator [Novosphingobium aerophilum]